jgi:hypothetical protein
VADAEIRTLGALMADATADLHLCVTLLVMDVLRGDPAEPLDEGHLAQALDVFRDTAAMVRQERARLIAEAAEGGDRG